MNIAVLGAGAFGSALAVALSRAGQAVTLWGRDPAGMARLASTRGTPRLPGATLPEAVTPTADLQQAAAADTLLLAVPAQSLRSVLAQIDSPMTGRDLVLCCKGIDLETGQGMAEAAQTVKPQARPSVLTGPSFAADIARGLPTALTLACTEEAAGQRLQAALSTPTLRLYRSTDTIGAELGGALKNVIAIASGACIGAGLGDSARAALMTRGFAEMLRLATLLGARAETLSGLSGLGDLTLTCTSPQSRNFRHGLALGRGETPDTQATVEGIATARAAARLAATHALPLPICSATAALTEGRLTVQDAMDQLLSRPLKEE